MSEIKASIVGIEKIYALVNELKDVDRNKAIRYGLLQGAKVLERMGKVNLKQRNDEHTGNLMQSVRAKLARRGVTSYAGFERSSRLDLEKGSGNHAHLVDRGTVERYTKDRKYRGIMPASYFWTEAKSQGQSEVSSRIENGIERAVERLKEKYAG